jgi:hypothetical protein
MAHLSRGLMTALVTLSTAAGLICALVLELAAHAAGPGARDDQVALGGDPPPGPPPLLPPGLTATPAPTPAPTPASTPAPAPPPRPKPKPVKAKGAPCWTTAKACVKLSSNQAWLIRDGKAVYGPVQVTHGRTGWLTPPGTFSVSFKNADHKSSLFDDAPMPNSVFFNGGIAFHQGSLSQLSHGCVHLSWDASKRFFGALSVGDVVQVVR